MDELCSDQSKVAKIGKLGPKYTSAFERRLKASFPFRCREVLHTYRIWYLKRVGNRECFSHQRVGKTFVFGLTPFSRAGIAETLRPHLSRQNIRLSRWRTLVKGALFFPFMGILQAEFLIFAVIAGIL